MHLSVSGCIVSMHPQLPVFSAIHGNHSLSRIAMHSVMNFSSELENSWSNGESDRNRQSRIKCSIAASSKGRSLQRLNNNKPEIAKLTQPLPSVNHTHPSLTSQYHKSLSMTSHYRCLHSASQTAGTRSEQHPIQLAAAASLIGMYPSPYQ